MPTNNTIRSNFINEYIIYGAGEAGKDGGDGPGWTKVACGEHEYTRWGFQQIIEKKAMDIIQPDLRRCGGFTEGRRIAAQAAAAGITLIPHAYGVTHIHLALAFPGIPMVEYFPLPCWDQLPDVEVQPIFHGEPIPANGQVTMEPRPGLGVQINEAIFE